jgi:glutathione synthase
MAKQNSSIKIKRNFKRTSARQLKLPSKGTKSSKNLKDSKNSKKTKNFKKKPQNAKNAKNLKKSLKKKKYYYGGKKFKRKSVRESKVSKKPIKIGIVVNNRHFDLSNLRIAYSAVKRGHSVYFIGVGDFFYTNNEKLRAITVINKSLSFSNFEEYNKEIQDISRDEHVKIDVGDLDLLMMRFDPSLEPPDRDWARFIAIDFGMFAVKEGVIVLNSPEGLSKSRNKLYLQNFPEKIRTDSIIARDEGEIKKFYDKKNKIIMKPLFGEDGKNIFMVHNKEGPNINQIIEALSREGYVIAREYLKEAEKCYTRIYLMNGVPLYHKGQYAAVKVVHKSGNLKKIEGNDRYCRVKVTKQMLDIIDIIRPRIIKDGLFLVGLDIASDKLLELNVFMPGELVNIEAVTKVDFFDAIIDALERKVEYKELYQSKFNSADNVELAAL